MTGIKIFLGIVLGLILLLYIIGLAVPDGSYDGRSYNSTSASGTYRSLSDCLSKRETPGMKVGTESNAPAISYCRHWRHR